MNPRETPRLASVLLTAVLLAACPGWSGANQAPPAPYPQLVLGTRAALTPLDPLDPATVWSRLVPSGAVHVPLLTASPRDEAPAPGVIASWTVQDSGTALRLAMAPGYRWHDGPAVTAADVTFTLRYLAEQELAPFLARYAAGTDPIAPDTVLLRFREPVALHAVQWLVGLPTLPTHVWSRAAGGSRLKGPAAMVGCGPFRFESLADDGREATLARAEALTRPVRIGGVRLVHLGTPDSLLAALRRGRLDAIATLGEPLPARLVGPLARHGAPLALVGAHDVGVPHVLWFDTRHELGGSRAFRAAIAAILDLDTLMRRVATPLARRPGDGLVPGSVWCAADPEETPRGEAWAAGATLGSLGLLDLDGDGFRDRPSGLPLALTLRAPPDSRPAAEEVARQLARAGLRVRVRPVSGVAVASGAVDAMSVGRLPARSAAQGAYPSLADRPPLARGTLRDPEYLRRVDRVLYAEDSLAHRAALVALQDYVATQVPALALYWDEFLVPVSERRFTGWTAAAGLGLPHWELWTRLTPVSAGSRPEHPWAAIVAGLALAGALLLSLTRPPLPRRPRSLPRLPWAEARVRRKP